MYLFLLPMSLVSSSGAHHGRLQTFYKIVNVWARKGLVTYQVQLLYFADEKRLNP